MCPVSPLVWGLLRLAPITIQNVVDWSIQKLIMQRVLDPLLHFESHTQLVILAEIEGLAHKTKLNISNNEMQNNHH